MKIIPLFLVSFLFCNMAYANNVCDSVRSLKNSWNSRVPVKIDEHTELIQVLVDCKTETILFSKRILVSKLDLPGGVEQKKQLQHKQLHCNRIGLASAFGWTAVDVLQDIDSKYVFTLKTAPTDCL